jgi:hypothetical protein
MGSAVAPLQQSAAPENLLPRKKMLPFTALMSHYFRDGLDGGHFRVSHGR